MFEDSLVDSGGRLKTNAKYWVWGTFALNACVIAFLIIYPLLNPESLPKTAMTASRFSI